MSGAGSPALIAIVRSFCATRTILILIITACLLSSLEFFYQLMINDLLTEVNRRHFSGILGPETFGDGGNLPAT